MPSLVLVDSGPLIALFDFNDSQHKNVLHFFNHTKFSFISTLAVLTEVSHMLDFSVHAQNDFYTWVHNHGVIIADINQHDLPRLIALTTKYSDMPMDFADATLVIAAEKTGLREIVSLDSDFDIYRLPGREMIKNVYRP